METTPTVKHGLWYHIVDVVLNIVVIAAIVFGIRTFLVSPFQVDGDSMLSTLEHGQYIIINKLAYYIGAPERGDIVVLHPPTYDNNKYYVKRVIGLPGDRVTLRDGQVFVQPVGDADEFALPEYYLDDDNRDQTFATPGNNGAKVYTVPEGHYFVLGDNRKGSLDSRRFSTPYVPQHDIEGKVWFVALPITKIHAFGGVDYGL